jgi:hypothetical protein
MDKRKIAKLIKLHGLHSGEMTILYSWSGGYPVEAVSAVSNRMLKYSNGFEYTQ